MQFLLKVVVSALVIAVSSELAKRSAVYGAVVASLPLTSLLALAWLYGETRDAGAAAAFSASIFWAVLASLPMFLALSWLLRKGVGFVPALGAACVVAGLGYAGYLAATRP
ncbi:MAG: DUF3147 family protein [Elusimicrobia bacterium]|nr:DUF3147 family protein [Elusimicrobiota bacterium]